MNGEKNGQSEFERARRWRNIALAMVLFALVVLFFVMTMVRLKGHVFDYL